MDNSSPNDFKKDQGNNWILPGKSKSFPGNRTGNSINNQGISKKKGYQWLEQKVTYAGIKQRWLIVESAESKQSEIEKLNSKIEQEKKTALKFAKKL